MKADHEMGKVFNIEIYAQMTLLCGNYTVLDDGDTDRVFCVVADN